MPNLGNVAGDDVGKSYQKSKNSTAGFIGDEFGKFPQEGRESTSRFLGDEFQTVLSDEDGTRGSPDFS